MLKWECSALIVSCNFLKSLRYSKWQYINKKLQMEHWSLLYKSVECLLIVDWGVTLVSPLIPKKVLLHQYFIQNFCKKSSFIISTDRNTHTETVNLIYNTHTLGVVYMRFVLVIHLENILFGLFYWMPWVSFWIRMVLHALHKTWSSRG